MRQLLLLRHAKSASDDPTITDHARPLDARGQEAARLMRGALRELGVAPQLALVSSSRRTRQTLAALEPWDGAAPRPLIRCLDSLYLASADQLLGVLGQVGDEVERLLIVAHNPGLHDLCLALLGRAGGARRDAQQDGAAERLALDFPTGALAEFACPAAWSSLPSPERRQEPREELRQGQARLVRFLCPKDLPEMAS